MFQGGTPDPEHPTLGTRGFSRAARIFGFGRRPTHLTETGNRARKVSGTQGSNCHTRAMSRRFNGPV